MKPLIVRICPVILLCLFCIRKSDAEDLRKIADLSGYWKFSIGDNPEWANPLFDDSGWDKIKVPGKWENQGYDQYNGYAWYRKEFNMENVSYDGPLYMLLGQIDDAEEVYLNGKLLGKSGSFPPDYVTAYYKARRYVIPDNLLKMNSVNTIAIKVYDGYLDGGIINGHQGIYVSADNELLDLNLGGDWKFHPGDNKEWCLPEFEDDSWESMFVPSAWEDEGYPDYDGYAWYRKRFSLPGNIDPDNLYLSLGKIDDVDNVYLNGKHIGSVYDLRKDWEYNRYGNEYRARRLYKIPAGLLSAKGENEISVRVYDDRLRGGIYEGPVGLMSEENYKRYRNKYYFGRLFWDFVYSELLDEE